MNDSLDGSKREFSLKTCLACGGDWFRVADLYEFSAGESPERITGGAKSLRVCLCGTPLAPDIGAETGSQELKRFMASFHIGRKWLQHGLKGDADRISQNDFDSLVHQFRNLERIVGQGMRSGPGRPWRLPTRKPAAKGRDQIVLALEEKAGLTSRNARSVVNKFWKLMAALIRRGEGVETPLGSFQAVPGPKARKKVRYGVLRTYYYWPKRIVFRPGLEWDDAPDPKEFSVPQRKFPSDQVCCEQCGSVYFAQSEFRQYRDQYGPMPGGDLSPVTEDPIRVLVCICGNPMEQGTLRRWSIL